MCTIAACPRGAPPRDCLYPHSPAIFERPQPIWYSSSVPKEYQTVTPVPRNPSPLGPIELVIDSRYANSFWSTALCADGTVPFPRPPHPSPWRPSDASSRTSSQGESRRGEARRSYGFSHDQRCPMLAMTLEARLRFHDQRAVCPYGLSLCERYRVVPAQRAVPSRTLVQQARGLVFLLTFLLFMVIFTVGPRQRRGPGQPQQHDNEAVPGSGARPVRAAKPTFRLVIRRPQWSVFGEDQAKVDEVVSAQVRAPSTSNPDST